MINKIKNGLLFIILIVFVYSLVLLFKNNDSREYLKNHISNMIDQSNFLIDKMAEFKKGSK